MSMFNVGDRVMLINAEGMNAEYGSTATVMPSNNLWVSYDPANRFEIVWDNKNTLQNDGPYFTNIFALDSGITTDLENTVGDIWIQPNEEELI